MFSMKKEEGTVFCNFSVRVPIDIYEKIKIIAYMEKRSINYTINLLIEKSLKKIPTGTEI